ncbi:hypothetical protein OESDEN_07023 [Oesophagostomum dentatum]|uniref:Saposin B-type domain-containing protein n=1 Tax=Oesophagostomum dentatum TaxID=61180 RepID=A0A0B1TAA0_OESDE|nr:hypothetical protein OESDEN_07023 [Oesophagostomum dentatum]
MRTIIILTLVLSTAMMVEGYAKYWDNPLCSMCKDLVVDLVESAGKNIEEVIKKANDFCEKNAPFFLVDTCKGLIKSKPRYTSRTEADLPTDQTLLCLSQVTRVTSDSFALIS